MTANDLRVGNTLVFDGKVHQVTEIAHIKPGKGGAFSRAKLKCLETGTIIDNTFRANEKVEQAIVDRKKLEYLYRSGSEFVFMDQVTYDQISLAEDRVKDIIGFLGENMEVNVTMFNDEILELSLPDFVELEVTETEPGVRGDTATGGSKPATVAPGGVVKVPLFINIGDRIKIDTRTGIYLERVS